MLGTTHATNAVLERRNLRRVAVIRIGGPATHSVRPMFGWPRDLTDAISVGATIVDGGVEFDGRDLSPLDTDAIARFLGEVGGAAQGVVITSVFAPVSPRHELLAADIVKRELGEIHVSLSHEIGSIGLLERENATILNGALAGVARDVAEAMRAALAVHRLQPTRFFAQNDGTLMGLDHALRYPVLTIGSGPANSVRGAAFLTGISDSLVADVGGGSILVPDRIPGVSEIIRPEHFDAANAVGAAIASVSGQVDRIFHLGPDGRQAVLDEARDEARERAVAAGADPGTVQIIEVEEIPLAYLTSPAVRIRVKAAGTLGGMPEHYLQARPPAG
jgi:N-methylhydantoinase A/oxoprolinase/acetone carboxylase beta subunit